MLKVTLKFSFYCAICLFFSCVEGEKDTITPEMLRYNDSLAEARIDSAYAVIMANCDTLKKYQVPRMVDSLLKDSALLQHFFDSAILYRDNNKKVEKVIRQLQADCEASLLKETYKKARLRQRSKPAQRKK